MTDYKPGDIIVVPFPFSDLSGVKKRPALVLAVAEEKEIVCMMLTSVSKGSCLEYPLADWKEVGLLKPTVARIHRIFTITVSSVLDKIGQIDHVEFKQILGELARYLIIGKK
ncbi:MAG: type II toxin-antitoxin system PemK/MazF family toxin [Peptococcaceae bacterium MAG4]|nr:type II toxin-antitoxin system PemK/MazF family toxin [Peptococcaceae bacterium MAG4]